MCSGTPFDQRRWSPCSFRVPSFTGPSRRDPWHGPHGNPRPGTTIVRPLYQSTVDLRLNNKQFLIDVDLLVLQPSNAAEVIGSLRPPSSHGRASI